jgi:hypothetical protein
MSTPTLHELNTATPEKMSEPQSVKSPSTIAPSSVGEAEAQTAPKEKVEVAPTAGPHEHGVHPLAQLGNARKNFLLFIFAISTFVDVCNVSVSHLVCSCSGISGSDRSRVLLLP